MQPTPAYSDPRDIRCATKARYPTKSQAKKALRQLRRQPGRRHLEVTKQCKHCGGFHLGNPPGHQTYLRAGSPPLNPRRAARHAPVGPSLRKTGDSA